MAIIYGDQNPGNPNDSLVGTSGADEIYGLTGNDTIVGAGGADTLDGAQGDDDFHISSTSTIYGGAGFDTVYLDVGEYSGLNLSAAAAVERVSVASPFTFIYGSDSSNVFDFSGTTTFSLGGSIEESHLILAGGADTFLGGSGNDIVDGGTGGDLLVGANGNDILIGGSGADTFDGGAGDDTFVVNSEDLAQSSLSGGTGDDTLVLPTYTGATRGVAELIIRPEMSIEFLKVVPFDFYETLNVDGTSASNLFDLSVLQGTTGVFRLLDGADTFLGSHSGDVASGGAGADTLSGGDGADRLFGDDDADLLNGGDAGDNLDGGAGADVLSGDAGADRLLGGDGADSLSGGADNDTLTGGLGNDLLDGGSGTDVMNGEADADTLIGGAGDTLVGGDGDDRLVVSSADLASVSLSGGAGSDELQITAASGQTVLNGLNLQGASIERLVSAHIFGTAGSNTFNLTGLTSAAVDGFSLLAGDDVFSGSGVAESVDGGDGADRLSGGGGRDTLIGGLGADTLDGGGSASLLQGGGDDDLLYVSDAALPGSTLEGGDGYDTLWVRSSDGAGLANLAPSSTSSIEALSGGVIYGTDGANSFDLSGFQAVSVTGFQLRGGDDSFLGSASAESVDGGDGNDSIEGAGGKDGLTAGLGDDTLDGGTKADSLTGGLGDDALIGGAGADLLAGDGGSDRLSGGTGDDILSGGNGADRLAGGKGADELSGGGGADVLKGDGGDDTLSSGGGRDTLSGGDGEDTFLFDVALKSSHPVTITDFSVKDDRFLLDPDIFLNTDHGPLGKDAFVVGAKAEDAEDRIIYNEKSGALFFDLDGSGRGAAVRFAMLDPGLDLSHKDFFVL